MNGDVPSGSCKQSHPLRFTEFESAQHIFINELRFYSDKMGCVFFEDEIERIEQSEIALGISGVDRGSNATKINRLDFVATDLDHSIPSDTRPRVDT